MSMTREPQFDFGGSVSATYGNFNQFVRGDIVLYHYCPKEAFQAISRTMRLQASTRLATDCDFGVGQYATQMQPHKFPDLQSTIKKIILPYSINFSRN